MIGPHQLPDEGMVQLAIPVLTCEDVAAAVVHYRDSLGFHVDYQQADLGVMDRDHVRVLLARRDTGAGRSSAYFYVRDADALHAELAGRGARLQGEPVSHPWGLRDFEVLDLEGNSLTFGQPFE